ncbi:MAG: carbon storage regulator [Oscillospiraceae bacterium]|jgi:carbon storage regulator CsrA|nr:carbon storage regulator [Oscillospiraceae bacterium]
MLSVRDGDYILIGDDIKIKIVEGGTVSHVGIEAPKSVPILRRAVSERGFDSRDSRPREPESILEL